MESKRLISRKGIIAFIVCLLCGSAVQPLHAQSEAQITKAVKVFYKKGYQEGIDKLLKYMAGANPPSLTAYETWVNMEYLNYLENKELVDKITIVADSLDLESEESSDSVNQEFLTLLKEYPRRHFIDVCRESTMFSFSSSADKHLRMMLVDYDPDTAVSEKAKAYFEEGDEFYQKEDYELAELNYRKALNEDTAYYKAYLYLGGTFWAREDYDSAIVYFTIAKNLHPNLLEPRSYIIDILMEQGLYYRAKKECLEAFTVYPGFDMKLQMQKILNVENKYLEDHRFIRYFYPNDIKKENQRELTGIWNVYSSSKEKISRYCSEDGIIEPNGLTDDKYLEVYSFRNLLQETDPSDLPEYVKFGYKMMEEGFLEPYVFISMFHVDIYPQFKHYMSFPENRAKALEYVDKYLIEPIPADQ